MGPYVFKREDAEDFARAIGAKTSQRGDELFFQECPYCKGQTNDRKTFSINLRNGMYKCFRASCGAKGNMLTLAKDFDFSLGQNVDEYYRPTKHYKTFKPTPKIIPKPEAIAYLESRGISSAVAERYEVTDKDGVICFPFRDDTGAVVMIKYRNPNPQEGQSKEWFESGCKPILYGMEQCNPENTTLIVTEGQMDSLSVAEAGLENAVSVPGGAKNFTWIPYCWNWLEHFEKIIIFGDHEKGKITLYAEFYQHWKSKVWCVREQDYLDCKDANDILRKYGPEQIRKCVENAEQPPIPCVMDMAEVEDVDVNALEKLATWIPALDETLCGGLPFGQVVLITGKSGDGKSTFANQIMVNAVDQGHKLFIYSGELPNYLLKAWLFFQAAGPGNIRKSRRFGNGYEIEPVAKAAINEWFRDRVYLYDNRITDAEEPEEIKLVEIMEEVIRQKGTRVILLDNLMTAMDLEPTGTSSDKYDRQSVFMKKLARIAMKYNVLIVLVAHKRKVNAGDTNDTVSGSADIVNLASIVLSYERGSAEDDPWIRWLKVTKNRLFGRTHDGIRLTFDESSKRVCQDGTEPTWQYDWEVFGDLAEQSEIDFGGNDGS